jgi:hypothetical protein
MGRKVTKGWKLRGFKSVKVKLYEPTFDRFKMLCKAKGVSMQEQIEKYITKELS